MGKHFVIRNHQSDAMTADLWFSMGKVPRKGSKAIWQHTQDY